MTELDFQVAKGSVLLGGAQLGEPIGDDLIEGWRDVQGTTIKTPSAQGAYALRLVASDKVRNAAQAIALCVQVQVHEGVAGVLAHMRDGSAAEWWAKAADAPVTVILPIADPRNLAALVIRNGAAGNRASVVSVLGVDAYAIELQPSCEFPGAQDSLSLVAEQRIATEFENGGFDLLRQKWSEIPNHGVSRIGSDELNRMPDGELLSFYQAYEDRVYKTVPSGERLIQNWYYVVYGEQFRGKRVLDVGSGCGFDASWFAGRGADWTCLDIVEGNITNIARMARLKGLPIEGKYLADFASIDDLDRFDVIWCNGSMINAPFAFAAREAAALLEHLPVGGRWIELGYPKQRWEREGRLPLHRWGERTDGPGTPWMEWYDTGKMIARLAPARFDVLMQFDYAGGTLNWFDFQRWA